MPWYWLPMPHTISVSCPRCKSHSEFSFSVAQQINRKDRPYFEKSKNFKSDKVLSHSGWNYIAWHDPGISKNIDNIGDLPADYSPADFKPHPRYYTRNNANRGVIKCHSCDYRRLHSLNWPEDAYFQIDYKNRTLWAFNREMGVLILNYLSSTERKKRIISTTGHISQHAWLRKLPTVFQTKKATPNVVKKLEKILSL